MTIKVQNGVKFDENLQKLVMENRAFRKFEWSVWKLLDCRILHQIPKGFWEPWAVPKPPAVSNESPSENFCLRPCKPPTFRRTNNKVTILIYLYLFCTPKTTLSNLIYTQKKPGKGDMNYCKNSFLGNQYTVFDIKYNITEFERKNYG